ncbi:hypothetical protein ACSSWA_09670 [Melioribacter sp. Ez-97]|uniref:hypothetical protein n=1 Tax=Melioribacter sp. Ez-97 TaxID=3423434 RepID=UPI003ED99660
MKNLIKSFLIVVILLVNSCGEGITEPEPGRRDYVWEVDTLNYPYAPMIRIWGTSPNNIWTISSGEHAKSIAHFDGKSWSVFGVDGNAGLTALWGFINSKVFTGNIRGQIWQYNGSGWFLFYQLEKDRRTDIGINNIWGISENDFYAFGAYPDSMKLFNNSVIAHYYRGEWNMLNTGFITGLIANLYKNQDNGNIYFQVLKIGGSIHPDSTIICEYSKSGIKKLYTSLNIRGETANISLINKDVYFILGNRIAKIKNGKFNTILEINNSKFLQRLWGRSEKDLFLLMTDGLVHYDGSTYEYIIHFNKTGAIVSGSVILDKDAFFLIREYPYNLIYHGKLK